MDFFKHKYFFLFVFSLLFCTLLWADNALAQKDVSIPNPPAIEQKAESVLPQDIPNDTEIKMILLNGTSDDLKKLLEKKIDVNKDYSCSSLLNKAIQSLIANDNPSITPDDVIEKINLLINAGADVNLPGCEVLTPLAAVASLPQQIKEMEKMYVTVIEGKIDSSSDICHVRGVPKPCKETSYQERQEMIKEIHEIFEEETKKIEPYFVKIAKILVHHGADINKKSNGVPPLHFAAQVPQGENPVILKYLLEEGANPNATDFQGSTPLFVANFTNNKEVIDLLIKAGADTTIKNRDGKLYNEFKTGDYHRN